MTVNFAKLPELMRRSAAMLSCRPHLLNESCDPPGYRLSNYVGRTQRDSLP